MSARPSGFKDVRAYLQRQFDRNCVSVFMGAGFSSGALDPAGRTIPLGVELRAELFALCFPGEPQDNSGLQDLYHHALRHHRDALDALLRKRLTVDEASLPDWYRAWFSAPWARAWTLNVDVLEQAAARRFPLPRRIVSVSALSRPTVPPDQLDPGALNVIHLNGLIEDGPEHVTFATSQYGRRLADRDRFYSALASELLERSFVFVGTRLDESPLWQHLEAREVRERLEQNVDAPRSFLVTTELDRARRCLLQDFAIEWVRSSAEEFGYEVLGDAAHPHE